MGPTSALADVRFVVQVASPHPPAPMLALLAMPQSLSREPVSLQSAVESPPFPFDREAEKRARRAVQEAVRRHDEAQEVWLSAVDECVQSLKKQGMPPEAMIRTMKAFVRHAAVTDIARRQSEISRELMEQIIARCISEYYKEG